MLRQAGPGRGERRAPAQAVKQRHAKLGFEPADVLGDRRLREEESTGGARERAVVGHGLEDTHSSQIHKCRLTKSTLYIIGLMPASIAYYG